MHVSADDRPQLAEHHACCRGSKCAGPKRHPFREKCSLKGGLVLGGRIDPQLRRVRQRRLCVTEYGFDIELLLTRFAERQPNLRQLARNRV
jgi:hypothetical protein